MSELIEEAIDLLAQVRPVASEAMAVNTSRSARGGRSSLGIYCRWVDKPRIQMCAHTFFHPTKTLIAFDSQ